MKKWQRSNNGLMMNGMGLNHGRIRVPVSGWYHVYCLVDFSYMYPVINNQGQKIKEQSRKGSIEHAVFKSEISRGDQEEKIVLTQHPFERSQNMIYSKYSSYVSKDVYLNAGDEIYVKVSNISLAVNPPRNIFGVYMV